MSGDQNLPTPDNPPSLSEPPQRRAVIPPVPARQQEPVIYNRTSGTIPAGVGTEPDRDQVPATDHFYHPDDDSTQFDAQPDKDPSTPDEAVEWISSGDELQSRSSTWLMRMLAVSAVAGAVVFLITRDLVSTGSVVIVGLLFGFLGARKPPALQYRIDRHGIVIGRKQYRYNEFRAFSVADDRQALTVNLVPLKRFLPVLSIFCDPKLHDKIIAVLGEHLPMEVHKRDALDSIISRAKF